MPTKTLVLPEDTLRPVTVTGSTVILTESLSSSYVAVIVALPSAIAVTVPDTDTVATPVLLDDQAGVTVADVPSLYAAIAVTVAVPPTHRVVAEALTEISVTVASAVTTVMSTESLCPS